MDCGARPERWRDGRRKARCGPCLARARETAARCRKPVSRELQNLYRKRYVAEHRAKGLCVNCIDPAVRYPDGTTASYCEKHAAAMRAYQKRRRARQRKSRSRQ